MFKFGGGQMKNTKKVFSLIFALTISISFTLVELTNSISISNITEINIIKFVID